MEMDHWYTTSLRDAVLPPRCTSGTNPHWASVCHIKANHYSLATVGKHGREEIQPTTSNKASQTPVYCSASREEPLLNNNNVSSLISFLCQDFHRSRQSRKPASRECYCTTGEGTRSAESREGPSSSQGFRSALLLNGQWLFEVLLRKRG
ncbi:unnamed protein product [Arctogadus glacialis]